jgi:hypothetical protein
MAIRARRGTVAPTPTPMPIPDQSLLVPEGSSCVGLVDVTATVGTIKVGSSVLLSVTATTLDVLIVVCSTEVVDELDEPDVDELGVIELDVVELSGTVDVEDVVNEVAIPLIGPEDAEAAKS